MGRRDALLHQLATEPVALVERVLELEAQLAEAQAQIAELRRELFGSKAEKLSPEQQAHLDELAADLQQEAQQPPPLARRCWRKNVGTNAGAGPSGVRRVIPCPPVLETETVTLEPAEDKLCPHCGRPSSNDRRRSHRGDRPDSGQAHSPPHGAARSTPAAAGKRA